MRITLWYQSPQAYLKSGIWVPKTWKWESCVSMHFWGDIYITPVLQVVAIATHIAGATISTQSSHSVCYPIYMFTSPLILHRACPWQIICHVDTHAWHCMQCSDLCLNPHPNTVHKQYSSNGMMLCRVVCVMSCRVCEQTRSNLILPPCTMWHKCMSTNAAVM